MRFHPRLAARGLCPACGRKSGPGRRSRTGRPSCGGRWHNGQTQFCLPANLRFALWKYERAGCVSGKCLYVVLKTVARGRSMARDRFWAVRRCYATLQSADKACKRKNCPEKKESRGQFLLPASAALAVCGHLRSGKFPCLQVCFLGLQAFAAPWQSVDFVDILGVAMQRFLKPRQNESLAYIRFQRA